MRRFSKRLLLVLLGIAIAFVGITVSQTAPASAYIDEYKNKSGYRSLSQPLQSCYGAMYSTLTDTFPTDETVTLQDDDEHPGVQIAFPTVIRSFDEIKELYTAFSRDNPHFFYVDNRYSVQHYSVFNQEVYTHISLAYTMDAAQRAVAQQKLEDVVQSIIKDIPDTNDDFIKELRLHDALLKICTYDEEAAEADTTSKNKNIYSAYGALVEGRAVCEGYARAMQLLLNRVGIKNSLISGKSAKTGEGHIWNLVTINGYEYHLDPTWDDVGNKPQHIYFNCTNAQLQNTHIIDKRFSSVACGSVKDNYYIRTNLYLSTDDQDAIVDVIADQIKNYSKSIEMRFSPKAYDGALAFLRNGELTHDLVDLELYYTEHYLWAYTLYSYDDCYVLCMQKR